jgi:hypothetical protein
MKSGYSFVFAAVLGVAPLASGAVLFNDNFDTTSSSAYNINATSSDTKSTFGFDYSALSIPPAPHQVGNSTIGLKLEANLSSGSEQGITVSPKGQSFSSAGGGYRLTFDAWQNSNGPFPGGGTGSTEYLSGGIGYNNTTPNATGISGSGTWVSVSSDGDASATSTTARDYMIHDNSGTFVDGLVTSGVYAAPAGSQDADDPYYGAAFPGDAPPAGQATMDANQTGNVRAGAPSFAWVQYQIDVVGNTVTWTMTNDSDNTPPLLIATLNNAASTSGNISLGYQDVFSSVNGAPQFSFGLIDNVQVQSLPVPEPASLGLLTVAGFGLLKRRRRA